MGAQARLVTACRPEHNHAHDESEHQTQNDHDCLEGISDAEGFYAIPASGSDGDGVLKT